MTIDQENSGDRYKVRWQKPGFFAATIFVFLCGLFVSAAGAQDGWIIKDATKDSTTGTITTNEEHPDGRFRVTTVTFFPGSETSKTENVDTLKIEGGKVRLVSQRLIKWNVTGNKIFYSDYSYDISGNLSAGERWSFPLDVDENIRGSKIEEDYNSKSKRWEIKLEKKNSPATVLPKSTIENGLIGKWKVVDSWGEGEAKLVIEFRQEQDGIAGYIVQINDERLKNLGFTTNELVYRRFSSLKENYAECECRYRYSDTDANGLTTKQSGWDSSGLTFRSDRLSSGSQCVINQVEGNFRSKTVRIE